MKCITPRKPLLLWLDLTHDRSAETLIANRRARTTSAQQALQQSMSEVLPAAVETSAREG